MINKICQVIDGEYVCDIDISVEEWKALLMNEKVFDSKEGANKQVISSQADSLIKISRIWADFFPANTSNQPI
ncbi:hypothetical protein NUBL21995_50050 [Klebsiella pneumoniae]|nr:hypothetical protein NUBL21995_50050 [Klebsiella pneumoniae]